MKGAPSNQSIAARLRGAADWAGSRATPEYMTESTATRSIGCGSAGFGVPTLRNSAAAALGSSPLKRAGVVTHVAGFPSKPKIIELRRWSLATVHVDGAAIPTHIQ